MVTAMVSTSNGIAVFSDEINLKTVLSAVTGWLLMFLDSALIVFVIFFLFRTRLIGI